MVLLKKLPSKPTHSIGIIATSSNYEFLKEFGLFRQFNIKREVPKLSLKNVYGENEIGNVIYEKSRIKIKGSLG